MTKFFFVYDDYCIDELKAELVDYEIRTMTSILRECDTATKLYLLDINKHAIEVTNFFSDTSNNRWHKGVIEEYIEILLENFSQVVFILHIREFKRFKEIYPFLIDEECIQYFVNEDDQENCQGDRLIPLTELDNCIYVYDDISYIYNYDGDYSIISFSQLVKDFNGFSANFQFDKLLEGINYYIDLSTLVDYLQFRRDQVFIYEMILLQLLKSENLRLIILKKLVNELNGLFPFVFCNEENISQTQMVSRLDEDDKKNDIRNLSSIDHIYGMIDIGLKGHKHFKEAFKENLLKFKVLNKLGRRKILSVFLCGKSGVGKTEFARLLSKVMYPNETQIKLNFGNYSTEGVLNSLIGSPLGYIGSDKGGELINKVKDSESKIILIDEFEKANEQVFNFFYELLEDGQFTDRAGNIHNLDGYIIIFTSNLNENNYKRVIPEPLESRFDMRFSFLPLDKDEKWSFIEEYSEILIRDIHEKANVKYNEDGIKSELSELIELNNLRDIKRKVEDIIISRIEFKHMGDGETSEK